MSGHAASVPNAVVAALSRASIAVGRLDVLLRLSTLREPIVARLTRKAEAERWTALDVVLRWRAEDYDLVADIERGGNGAAARWCESLQIAAEWAENVTRVADELHGQHLQLVSAERLGRYASGALDLLARRGEIDVAAAVGELGTSPTTAGRLLERMAVLGIIDEVTGRRRGRVFRYTPFVELFDRMGPPTVHAMGENRGVAHDPLSLAEWVPIVAQRLFERSDAKRIIVFGSVARGEAGPDSDLDLLVVLEHVVDSHDDAVRLQMELRDFPIPIDVLVTDEERLEQQARWPGVVRVALREGQAIERAA